MLHDSPLAVMSFIIINFTNEYVGQNLYWYIINSLAPGRFEYNFRQVIFKLISVIDWWTWSFVQLPSNVWMSPDLTEHKSTLVQVMAWCCQATSHYLSQCWPRSVSPYGVIRPQWVKLSDFIPQKYHSRVLVAGTFCFHLHQSWYTIYWYMYLPNFFKLHFPIFTCQMGLNQFKYFVLPYSITQYWFFENGKIPNFIKIFNSTTNSKDHVMKFVYYQLSHIHDFSQQ